MNSSTFTEISKKLNRKSAILREVNRDGMDTNTYRAHKAHRIAQRNKKKQGRKRKIDQNPELKEYVHQKLKKHWSPKQIAKEIKNGYPNNESMNISHETIYSYIYVLPRGSLKKELLLYLRQQRKYRRRRSTRQIEEKRGRIPEMISIEERPKEVADRIIPGHWEGDLILGKYKKSALGTIVERTTRTVILVPLVNKDAVSVRKAGQRDEEITESDEIVFNL